MAESPRGEEGSEGTHVLELQAEQQDEAETFRLEWWRHLGFHKVQLIVLGGGLLDAVCTWSTRKKMKPARGDCGDKAREEPHPTPISTLPNLGNATTESAIQDKFRCLLGKKRGGLHCTMGWEGSRREKH